jgi:hypothetical protein
MIEFMLKFCNQQTYKVVRYLFKREKLINFSSFIMAGIKQVPLTLRRHILFFMLAFY